MADPLDRIATALERIAPPAVPMADLDAHPVYVWREGTLKPARGFAPLPLDLLIGVERQKAALIETLSRHAAGSAAQDALLWGARGTGKSALVKSVFAAVAADRPTLALVQATELADLPDLFALLAASTRRFVLFLDDAGFDSAAEARTLRSLLEGGAEPRPANTRLMVTANRRHLAAREAGDTADAVNPRDALDDQLALADRFGLSLGFHLLDQEAYLAIVAGYAAYHDLPFAEADALEWARRRGARSGRVAWQYVIDLAGRSGRGL